MNSTDTEMVHTEERLCQRLTASTAFVTMPPKLAQDIARRHRLASAAGWRIRFEGRRRTRGGLDLRFDPHFVAFQDEHVPLRKVNAL